MSVAFIGLGLNDEKGLTIEGLEEARQANSVFAEFYTNTMPGLDRKKLELLLGKKVVVLNRVQLEDEEGKPIVEAAERGKVALLVPGDPMTATTHISIRLGLARRGIPSRIIHGPSVTSAGCGRTGLQSYTFGKSVTLPKEPGVPGSCLETSRHSTRNGGGAYGPGGGGETGRRRSDACELGGSRGCTDRIRRPVRAFS